MNNSQSLNDESMEKHNLGHFGFTAIQMSDLGASEYTLVTIVCDRSGSTDGFQKEMEEALQEVVKACAHSPRADNLMLRVVTFEDSHVEIHGWKLLESVNAGDYQGILSPGGATALFDAAVDAVEATVNWATQLDQQDYLANAIVFVITDGCNNRGASTIASVKKSLQEAVRSESLESIITILIGVNVTDSYVSRELDKFRNESGFNDYIELKDAHKSTLAKLANFVSQSISSQSQALGSGAPSASIKF